MKRIVILIVFLVNTIGPCPPLGAQELRLPTPGVMVHLSPEYNPTLLKGIKVHPDNPFRFDFILDVGDGSKPSLNRRVMNPPLQKEATKLVKYFLASLTIPEQDLWVNLSPYEKNRIIPTAFGKTEMGRDLLAEDYMLKQITASLIYPEGTIGKKFWKRIYTEAAQKFGTTNIPVNTFNKVWIVPEKAVVYENAKAGTAYVVESKLKVMLEQDYLALDKNNVGVGSKPTPKWAGHGPAPTDINALGSQVVRAIVIPELTKEVNLDKNFTPLRQVYNSLILATWYKEKIKNSILAQVYENKKKIVGIQYTSTVIPAKAGIQNTINSDMDPRFRGDDSKQNDVNLIYQRYLQAFKKGAYNYIKEEIDPATQEMIPRKYFSGGMALNINANAAMLVEHNPIEGLENDQATLVEVNLRQAKTIPMALGSDAATVSVKDRAVLAEHSPRWDNLPEDMLEMFRPFIEKITGNRPADRQLSETVEPRTVMIDGIERHGAIYTASEGIKGVYKFADTDFKEGQRIKFITILENITGINIGHYEVPTIWIDEIMENPILGEKLMAMAREDALKRESLAIIGPLTEGKKLSPEEIRSILEIEYPEETPKRQKEEVIRVELIANGSKVRISRLFFRDPGSRDKVIVTKFEINFDYNHAETKDALNELEKILKASMGPVEYAKILETDLYADEVKEALGPLLRNKPNFNQIMEAGSREDFMRELNKALGGEEYADINPVLKILGLAAVGLANHQIRDAHLGPTWEPVEMHPVVKFLYDITFRQYKNVLKPLTLSGIIKRFHFDAVGMKRSLAPSQKYPSSSEFQSLFKGFTKELKRRAREKGFEFLEYILSFPEGIPTYDAYLLMGMGDSSLNGNRDPRLPVNTFLETARELWLLIRKQVHKGVRINMPEPMTKGSPILTYEIITGRLTFEEAAWKYLRMKEDQGEPHRLITVLHSLNPPPIPIDETPHHPPETNPANRAQLAWEKGGIDLSAQRTKFLIQHQGDDIQFNIDPALLEQVKNASGFVPVIIKMQPLYNVSAFLGMAQPPTAGVTPQGQPG